ncbi:MAG: phosphopyruvate hydratase [Gemmatimonadota bacterium]|nr:phosphopyruvate hydratase [Gemmatimonadota bacterium]
MTVDLVTAREILDSRGLPTVEVAIGVGGEIAIASVPSGKSTGKREALERRDKDAHRYGGKGVLGAVGAVNGEIAATLLGHPLPDREALDRRLCELDGTPNKSRLGANAILAVSLAAARIRARIAGVPLYESLGGPGARLLPVPCFNVINGGAHAPNELAFQEFMLVPAGFDTYGEALRAGAETYHALAKLLADAGLSTAVGDEGGFAPAIRHPTDALDWIVRAIEAANYKPGVEIFIALDPAASAFFSKGKYHFAGSRYESEEMTDLYAEWMARYPIVSIEDGFAEDDVHGWKHVTERLGARVQIVGDDIFVSNPDRIRWAIGERIANAVLLKPNQIGTVSEIFDTTAVAESADYHLMMSHRSGETDDSFIADLAVALGTGQIKAGAPARGERLAKYNQLLRIEDSLGSRAQFAGIRTFRRPG